MLLYSPSVELMIIWTNNVHRYIDMLEAAPMRQADSGLSGTSRCRSLLQRVYMIADMYCVDFEQLTSLATGRLLCICHRESSEPALCGHPNQHVPPRDDRESALGSTHQPPIVWSNY